jgi:hypothetical protein
MNESKITNENTNNFLSRLNNLPGLNILPSDYYGNDIDYKIEMLAVTFNDLYLRTKKELQELFTKGEALGISQAFCGTMFTQFNKQYLLTQIKDSILLEGIDSMFEFDGVALINKINSLTEFQCMTVIGMVNEFNKTSSGNIISDEILNKIFIIG